MQIQVSIWKSYFSWAGGSSWHWAFPVPVMTVLGVLRGRKGRSCCQALALALLIHRERRTPAPSGQEGLGSWSLRYSLLLRGAVLLALWSRKPLKLLPGRGFCCPYLTLTSSPAFVTQENLGANFRPAWFEGWWASSREPLILVLRPSPSHWPQLGCGAEHRTGTLPLPGAQTAQVLLPRWTPNTPGASHSSSLVSGALPTEKPIQFSIFSNVQYRKAETVNIYLNIHILFLQLIHWNFIILIDFPEHLNIKFHSS